ncbi:hypothetical protein TNCV_1416351 [Trichonephila clavipes]|nr:hypothetical protein TNCV_1416351 [Trichonephila clavipes]
MDLWQLTRMANEQAPPSLAITPTAKHWALKEAKMSSRWCDGVVRRSGASSDYMLTKYQMITIIDFCEVWFLPKSVAKVAAIVGDHRCHTPRH